MPPVVLHIVRGSNDASTLASILGGALPVLLGALIAFGTTWWFAQQSARDHRLGLGYSLFFRASDATNAIMDIHRAVTRNIPHAPSPHSPYKWQVVQVPVGFDWSHRIRFEPDELALLARAGRFDLVNDLTELGRGHDILFVITADYARRREDLTNKLRGISKNAVSGTEVSSFAEVGAFDALAPDMMLVEDLLDQILPMAAEISAFGAKLTTALGPAIKDALHDKRYRGKIEVPASIPPDGAG